MIYDGGIWKKILTDKKKNSWFKGVRPVTAKTGWREGNINRHKT